jgi:hypothetical protein
MQYFSTQLPITFDLNEAVSYYHELEKNYQHLKWTMPELGFRHTKENITPTITGWAIQTPKAVDEPHCMLYDTNIQGREFYKETPCAFGFAQKLLTKFPTAFRMYITVNSPGVVVVPHVDNENIPRRVYKIIIPIQTNNDATWTVDEGTIHLNAGSVYLVDTLKTHGTQNDGNTDRVHFMFELLAEDLELIKNTTGCI